MKKLNLFIGSLILIYLPIVVNSQINDTAESLEEITLITDRSLYSIGEQIQFKANLFCHSNEISSKVMYIELITPLGISVTKNKFPIKENISSGSIQIPNDILSCYYYVKAYTKSMRNEGPTRYSYTRLKIINPHSDNVLSYNPTTISDSLNNSTKQTYIDIKSEQKDENIELTFKPISKNSKLSNISLAIIPSNSYNPTKVTLNQDSKANLDNTFFTETRGISVTGKIVNSDNNESLAYRTINLSIIGENRDFMAQVTDSSGHFYFSLPDFYGKHNILLSTSAKQDIKHKILVHNDYCNKSIIIPTPKFMLTQGERESAYKMALNSGIHYYFNETREKDDTSAIHKKPFYGKPDNTVYIDDYIQLKTLEDYIKELPVQLRVVKRKKQKFIVIDKVRSTPVLYDPIVLVDLVAITDFKKILSIPGKNISHIDIMYEPYTKGDITYGGVISIFSKKNDYCGISLPHSGIFLNYDFFKEPENIENNIPLKKNTLYWNPNIDLNKTNQVKFNINNSSGDYILVMKGVYGKKERFTQIKPISIAKGKHNK